MRTCKHFAKLFMVSIKNYQKMARILVLTKKPTPRLCLITQKNYFNKIETKLSTNFCVSTLLATLWTIYFKF